MDTHADSTSDTLILFDLVSLLHLCRSRLVNLLHAHIFLTTTKLRSVDGDEETLDASLLCVLDVLPGDLTVAVNIELDEEFLAWGSVVDDVIE